MAKIRNICGEDRMVPWVGRIVEDGEVVVVPDSDVLSYLADEATWDTADAATAQLADALLATAAEEQAAAASAGHVDDFDPSAHTVADVLAYLAQAGADEQARVLEAERAGKDRTGIVGKVEENS